MERVALALVDLQDVPVLCRIGGAHIVIRDVDAIAVDVYILNQLIRALVLPIQGQLHERRARSPRQAHYVPDL